MIHCSYPNMPTVCNCFKVILIAILVHAQPAVETPVVEQQQASNQTGSSNAQSNDTNSTTQNEISPLKREHSESTAASDEQTPARKKSKRIDKFKEESEALLRSFGLKEATDSEKRLTRSRTRGTPVSTPVAKPVRDFVRNHSWTFARTTANRLSFAKRRSQGNRPPAPREDANRSARRRMLMPPNQSKTSRPR